MILTLFKDVFFTNFGQIPSMKRFFLLNLLLFFVTTTSVGQFKETKFINPTKLYVDTIKIQKVIAKCEKSTNPLKVVKVLNDTCRNDLEKIYGVYTYIASSFSYDLKRAKQIGKNEIKRELYITEVMKKRKGVCGDFATLFKLLADSLHVPCFRVDGYALTGRIFHPVKQKRINHAWNMVKVAGQWYPVDVTYGMQNYTNKDYNRPHVWYTFLMQNKKWFSLMHLPVDPDFQLYTRKISFKDFRYGKWFFKDPIRDSLGIVSVLDSRYSMSYSENVLKTAENAVENAKQIKYLSIKAILIPLTKVIDKKTKYKEKITEDDIQLAKDLYSGLIELNERQKAKGYKRAIRYCEYQLIEVDKLERKLFPKKFK